MRSNFGLERELTLHASEDHLNNWRISQGPLGSLERALRRPLSRYLQASPNPEFGDFWDFTGFYGVMRRSVNSVYAS